MISLKGIKACAGNAAKGDRPNSAEANPPNRPIRIDAFISSLPAKSPKPVAFPRDALNDPSTRLLVAAGFTYSMMRLDDAVADNRSHIEACRAGYSVGPARTVVVGIV